MTLDAASQDPRAVRHASEMAAIAMIDQAVVAPPIVQAVRTPAEFLANAELHADIRMTIQKLVIDLILGKQ